MYNNSTVSYSYITTPVYTYTTGSSSSINIDSFFSNATQQQLSELTRTTGLSSMEVIEQCIRTTFLAKRKKLRKRELRRGIDASQN